MNTIDMGYKIIVNYTLVLNDESSENILFFHLKLYSVKISLLEKL